MAGKALDLSIIDGDFEEATLKHFEKPIFRESRKVVVDRMVSAVTPCLKNDWAWAVSSLAEFFSGKEGGEN